MRGRHGPGALEADPIGHSRSTVVAVRKVEAVSWLPATSSTLAEQTRQRVTNGNLERHLTQPGRSSPRL